jgi:hypothetical protein
VENEQVIKPELPENKKKFKKWLIPFLWIFGSFFFFLISSVLLLFFYEDEIKDAIIGELNTHLNSEIKVDPKNIDLTIISTFPNTAINFKEITCFEVTKNKNRDTLFFAEKISLQFNVMNIINENYSINYILFSGLDLRLKVDEHGQNNYSIWKSNDTTSTAKSKVDFSLEDVELENIKIAFTNKKEKTKIILDIEDVFLKGDFKEINYSLKSKGKLFLEKFIYKKINYANNKNITYSFEMAVNNELYVFKKSEFKINDVLVELSGEFQTKNKIIYSNLNFSGKNLELTSALSLLPKSQQDRIKEYEGTGKFNLSGKLSGPLNSEDLPLIESEFGIANAQLTYKPNKITATNITLNGKYNNKNGYDELELKNIQAFLNNNKLNGDFRMINFNEPYIDSRFSLNANLSEVLAFYPIDTIENLSGKIDLRAQIKGKLSMLKQDLTDASNYAKGNANFKDVSLKFKNDKNTWDFPFANIEFSGKDLQTDSIKLIVGKNDFELKGTLTNFIPWLFKKNEPISISATSFSDFISVDEIINNSSSESSNKEFSFPENFTFQLNTFINKLNLGKFNAEKINGEIKLINNKLFSDNLSFDAMGGKVQLKGLFEEREKDILMKGSTTLTNIDVKRMMYELNNFAQEEILDKHVKGVGNFSIDFSTLWDKKWKCKPEEIIALLNININQGELKEYKPIEKLSKFIDLKELQNIKFNELKCELEIKNKVISVSKTNIQNSALNLEFYGKHDFDNNIDYHIKLLLSDFLAKRPGKNKQFDDELSFTEKDPDNKRTVFLSMKGNIKDPIIKFDRKAMKEKIKEDIKNEKNNLKAILNEEFGLFKKDTTLNRKTNSNKSNQVFLIDNGNKTPEKKDKLQPKKEKQEEEDF